MAKGSKFVQEAHIDNLNIDEVKELDSKTNKYKRLFCDLNNYESKLKEQGKLSEKLIVNGTLKAYRYSPSKINIALGWFSAVIATILCFSHIFIAFCCFNRSIFNDKCILISFLITAIIICFIVLCFIYCLTTDCLKGGIQSKQKTKS